MPGLIIRYSLLQIITGGQPGWALSPRLAVFAAHALGPVAAHVAGVPTVGDPAAPPEQGIAEYTCYVSLDSHTIVRLSDDKYTHIHANYGRHCGSIGLKGHVTV